MKYPGYPVQTHAIDGHRIKPEGTGQLEKIIAVLSSSDIYYFFIRLLVVEIDPRSWWPDRKGHSTGINRLS